MPHLFIYALRSYRKGSSFSTACEGSRKVMDWSASGHKLRSNPRTSHLSGSFKPCFRLNRLKLAAGWVYCRRRSYGVHKNNLRNKSQDNEKCDAAKCDVMDQLSIVTRYHMFVRNNKNALKGNHGHKAIRETEANDASSSALNPDLSNYKPYNLQCSVTDGTSYLFEDDMKWKEVWSSFLGCPYSEIHNSKVTSKNLILMRMHKSEKESGTCANEAQTVHSGPSGTKTLQESSAAMNNNRLIILRGPDNCMKNITMCSVNVALSKSKECSPASASGVACQKEMPATNANFNPESSLQPNDKKSWSLFRISNGSVIPLYWVQNNQGCPIQTRSDSQSSDLRVNNANWFTKSVLSNLIGTEEQSTQMLLNAPDSSKQLLNGYVNPLMPALSGLPNDHEKESDSQKLIRSCHEFVYDNSGSQIHRCKSCSKLFTSLTAFCDHVISTHNQAKNRCGVCHKHFSRSWLLKGHMRTHTGERPYKCHHPGCNKAFADKSNLRSHTLIHTVVGKKFVCQRCQRAFAQKRYLHKHQFEVCKILT